MTSLSPIAELAALNHADSVVRIPDQTDVPLTPRVKRIIDTSAFRRLASVRQLGFVSLVYPGAVHNRMEHSLGVYRNTLLYLQQLCRDSQFESVMDEATLDAMILGALVHDLGHYPYCHPVEDIGLAEVRQHEELARESLESDSFRELI
jgi:HD superfamily phosphohydrolase